MIAVTGKPLALMQKDSARSRGPTCSQHAVSQKTPAKQNTVAPRAAMLA